MVRLAKCSRGSDHAEKIEQRGNWLRVELLYCVDQLIAKTRVRKLFAQPMEPLHDAIPRHGIVDPALIAKILPSEFGDPQGCRAMALHTTIKSGRWKGNNWTMVSAIRWY